MEPNKPIMCCKKIQVTDNMTAVERVILFASEATGTAIMVCLGCMGCVEGFYTAKGLNIHLPHEQICWTFGLGVMIAIQVVGHISGSHINPAVTLTAATLGMIPLIQIPIYWVGQILGAIAGFALLTAVTPAHYVKPANASAGVCSPVINSAITPMQGLLVEFIATLILALVCCGVWDVRNSTKHDSTPIRFGLTVACLAFATGPYTGTHMNPARSFGPALINGDWKNHWVYWVGPLAGGFIGPLFYRLIFGKEPEDTQRNQEATPGSDKH